MEPLHPQITKLVQETCRYQQGSPERQKGLTRIILLISPYLWKDSTPDYQDALQKTWIYFCQNLCEGCTGQPYDPEKASAVTWLNAYLKRRLQDARISRGQHASRFVSLDSPLSSGESDTTMADFLPAQPDIPPILEKVYNWAEEDANQELSQFHIENHPEVTCQVLILRRLPPETPWKELSEEFGLSVSTLSSFYQRQCLPKLKKFAESEGLL